MNKEDFINSKVERFRKILERDMTYVYRVKDKSKNQYLKCHCGSIEWYLSDGKPMCKKCYFDGYLFDDNMDLDIEST